MQTVTISSKYQIVIPKEVREKAGLRPGAPLEVLCYGGRIELVPIGPMASLRASLPGLNTDIDRDENGDDRGTWL